MHKHWSKGDRFIVIPYGFDLEYEQEKMFFGKTGTVVRGGVSTIYEAKFDDEEVQNLYLELGKRKFETWSVKPTTTKEKRDSEFTSKLKNALAHLIESEELQIKATIEEDYDGKLIQTSVLIDGTEIYSSEDRISDWGEPVDSDY